MQIEIDGVIPGQHGGPFLRDPPRIDAGNPRPDANDFHMRDFSQRGQQGLQALHGQEKGVSPRQENILDIGGLSNVLQGRFHVRVRQRNRFPPSSLPRAKAAMHGTLVGNQPEDPAGVTVHQVRHGGKSLFGQGILHASQILQFTGIGDALSPDGIAGRVHEACIIRVELERKICGHRPHLLHLHRIISPEIFQGCRA